MMKSQQMSQLSHAQFPLRRHPHLLVDHRRAGSASVADSRGADAERLTGSGGRLHFGTVAGFKSESVAGLRRNSHATPGNLGKYASYARYAWKTMKEEKRRAKA